ncbi:hypothetical protein P9G84_02530 [Brevibacillus centrosporus]|uniref:hypothetical protein n=1 Tax=Brevibacillus centrosporus TaxID=54910 RepID=UPI0011436487|nr:hypothetical protein [Brevibacillus centrosporus]MEC2127870.1 hypothetical protein [Brevibacillus centrosporus]GED32115.1 hypothetical protein BCE02nite_32560 [Brevibacillus centrosporus]
MSAQRPIQYYLTQLEVDVLDNGSGQTTIFRTLSKDDVTSIKDIGDAPYKKFIKRERRVIQKCDLVDYPPLVDLIVKVDEDSLATKSLMDDEWFNQLVQSGQDYSPQQLN